MEAFLCLPNPMGALCASQETKVGATHWPQSPVYIASQQGGGPCGVQFNQHTKVQTHL